MKRNQNSQHMKDNQMKYNQMKYSLLESIKKNHVRVLSYRSNILYLSIASKLSGMRYDTCHGVMILFSIETYNLYSIVSQLKRLIDPMTIGISLPVYLSPAGCVVCTLYCALVHSIVGARDYVFVRV